MIKNISKNIKLLSKPLVIEKNDDFSKQKAIFISKNTGIPIENLFDETIDKINSQYNLVNNWTQINSKWYFIKHDLDYKGIINELLGVEITNHFGLKSANNIIAKIKNTNELVIASENCFEKNKEYYYYNDLKIKKDNLKQVLNDIKNFCVNNNDTSYQLLNNIIKMTIRDLYSGDNDRHSRNFFIEKTENKYNLAPLFDYDQSFKCKNLLTHENVILKIYLNNKNDKDTINNNIFFQESLAKLEEIDMNILLNTIENKHGIKINDTIKNYYLSCDKNIKEKIKRFELKK